MNNFQFYNLYKIIPSNDEKYIKRIVSEFWKTFNAMSANLSIDYQFYERVI